MVRLVITVGFSLGLVLALAAVVLTCVAYSQRDRPPPTGLRWAARFWTTADWLRGQDTATLNPADAGTSLHDLLADGSRADEGAMPTAHPANFVNPGER